MTPSEAKMRILAEWRTWIGHREIVGAAPEKDALDFFGELAKVNPDLLSFETDEDKWDAVKRWLFDAGLIRNS
jgi:hypothetical protein